MTVILDENQDISSKDLYREEFPDIPRKLKEAAQKSCNRNLILNRLPIIKWLPKYRKKILFEDFVAGLTVGLTAIPQGIAYAVIAGLEPQYGLYSAFVGCFVYFIFGSCKDITIGPTAIMALMVQRYVSASPDFAVLATFLSGIVIFLCGMLNLGFLIQFISLPVSSGFVTAAAITIASGQLKSLLGIRSGKTNEFIESWENIFHHYNETQLWDTVLGVMTVICLLALRKMKDIKGKYKLFFKYFSLSRNALAVIFGTLLAYLLTDAEKKSTSPFVLTGNVTSGFPPIQPPPFSTEINGTTLNFIEMLQNLGTSTIAIPLISILESVAVAKAFSKGKIIDATQEMFALGLCNIIGSFFRSMPTTGSFTRTAINHSSGVRTTMGGLFTGGIVLLALGFLTQMFYYIPKTTLAAVILSAMFFMVEYEVAIEVWRTRRIDIIPFLVTVLACLGLGLEYGILIGVASNIILILYKTARPNSTIEHRKISNREVLMITPDQSLIFSAAEYIRYKILKYGQQSGTAGTSLIVVNGEHVQFMDVTVASNLKVVADDLRIQNKEILFWNWNRQPIGVAHRLDADFGKLFVNTESLASLCCCTISDNNLDVRVES